MAITSLFGPTPAQIEQARQLQMDQQISGEGAELGPFRGLYQASRRLGSAGTQSLVSGLFPEAADPAMRQAQAVQLVQQKYQGQNLSDPLVLKNIASDLFSAGAPDAGLRILKTAQDLMPKQESVAVAPGGTLVDKRTGKIIFQAPDRDKEMKLANRLVELDTKLATEGLTPKEAAEKTALERVVRIQSPKGTTVDFTGIGEVLAKKASEEEGKKLGQDLAALEGKRQAVESLTNARQILSQGVYTGSYANFQTELAKKSLGAVGDIRTVENTEVFLNEVSSNVIPLLQEFGGNDSNEELRFLQRLVGGDVTLQQKSIERILDNSIRKINRGIERTAARGQAVREGKPPELPKPTTKTEKRTTKGGVTYEIVGD
jgi:hypothetical protein